MKKNIKYGLNGETAEQLLMKVKNHLGGTESEFKSIEINAEEALIQLADKFGNDKVYEFTVVEIAEFDAIELFAMVSAAYEFSIKTPYGSYINIYSVCDFRSADECSDIYTYATISDNELDEDAYELYCEIHTHHNRWVDLETIKSAAINTVKSYLISCLSTVNGDW